MKYQILSMEELTSTHVGEAVTFTAVMAVMIIAVVAVVIYKIFTSSGGATIKLPGGYQFTWK